MVAQVDGVAAGLPADVERVRMTTMTPGQAWRDGVRRVARAPAIVMGVWLVTMLVSVPLALSIRVELMNHLGASLAAESAAQGVNYEWMQEFADQAAGLGTTFRPTIIGFAAVLDNLSAFMDGVSRPVVVVGAAATYIVLWLFLAGGIIDRYARDRRTGAHGFFSASGGFFFRFVRLAAVMAVVYGLLFGLLRPWMFDRAYTRLIHNINVEQSAFMIRASLYLAFGLLLAAANVIFDYAKVRAVVEDRRSALGALSAALNFVRRNAAAAIGVYALNVVVFGLTLAVYALLAPRAGGTGWMMWVGFVIGQVYVILRLCVKLIFWASETSLFQSRLAHAGYVATPAPAWPDSPIAEALRPSPNP
jgi:hypothetical protein